MSNQNNSTASEGVTEFIVHTKHTCDSCYKRPIVGKRFTSGAVTDFDLCAKCFDGYDEEKKGEFTETLLARDKATKNSFVLKLKIETGGEEAQTRRINVTDLWDSNEGLLSFNKLIKIAQDFALVEADEKETAKFNPKVTYIDEDGDKINISSNEELMDSFIQTVKKQPFRPFRITACVSNSLVKTRVDASTTPIVKLTRGVDVHALSGKFVQGHLVTDASRKAAVNPRGPGRCGTFRQKQLEDLMTAAAEQAKSGIFIHARHTCDVCSKTPIVGTRFHATKVPDFDLCEACMKSYDGEDLAFVPELLVRDIRMQGKWLKKQLKKMDSKKEIAALLEETREVELTDQSQQSSATTKKDCELDSKVEEDKNDEEKDVVDEANQDIDKESSHKIEEADEEPTAPAPAPFFIHARHTCDGCSRTPIIGTRYRATKIPDFDLCEACYKSYEGEDLDFKPETLDIDTHMQPKWIMHQLAKTTQASKGIVNLMKVLEGNAKAAMASKASSSPSEVSVKVEEEPVDEKLKSTQGTSCDSKEDATNTVKDTNESFLSDAEGNGDLAEVIGRTLDVCVQAMEKVLDDEMDEFKNIDKKDIDAIVSAAADAYSVGSSMVSSVTDILKKMEDHSKGSKGTLVEMPDVPSTVSGATILQSVDGTRSSGAGEDAHVDDTSVGSEEWSVINDTKSNQKKDGHVDENGWQKDEFAGAAEMIGSFLFESGVMSLAEKGESKDVEADESKEPLSPVVLAKWDTELKQLNELGFVDERKNVDVLERLEAAHVGCDSTDKVTINAAVEALLAAE